MKTVRPSSFIVKVCGLKQQDNLLKVDDLNVDFIGMIFYEPSKRYAGASALNLTKVKAKKVGVFVNADLEEIKKTKKDFQLDVAQLHGDESVDFCKKVNELGLIVWKVFGVDEQFDFNDLTPYSPFVQLFLFDTKSPLHGGTGIKFNWNRLKDLNPDIRYLLSGGIGPDDLEQLKLLNLPGLMGVDLNSRFESTPGIKNTDQLKKFIDGLKNS